MVDAVLRQLLDHQLRHPLFFNGLIQIYCIFQLVLISIFQQGKIQFQIRQLRLYGGIFFFRIGGIPEQSGKLIAHFTDHFVIIKNPPAGNHIQCIVYKMGVDLCLQHIELRLQLQGEQRSFPADGFAETAPHFFIHLPYPLKFIVFIAEFQRLHLIQRLQVCIRQDILQLNDGFR